MSIFETVTTYQGNTNILWEIHSNPETILVTLIYTAKTLHKGQRILTKHVASLFIMLFVLNI